MIALMIRPMTALTIQLTEGLHDRTPERTHHWIIAIAELLKKLIILKRTHVSTHDNG